MLIFVVPFIPYIHITCSYYMPFHISNSLGFATWVNLIVVVFFFWWTDGFLYLKTSEIEANKKWAYFHFMAHRLIMRLLVVDAIIISYSICNNFFLTMAHKPSKRSIQRFIRPTESLNSIHFWLSDFIQKLFFPSSSYLEIIW